MNQRYEITPETLTKRETIAAMAMQGFLAADHEHIYTADQLAAESVKQADALLDALAGNAAELSAD